MKVLMITPYVTITGRPEFERNKTGFGYMVMDIAKAVARTESVELFATDSRGEAFNCDNVEVIPRAFSLFFKHIYNCLSPVVVLRIWKHYRISKETLLRLVYYWLSSGYIKNIIQNEQYDVIQIHGCGFGTELWMQVCNSVGQKYVVTLHGLNSFSDTIHLEQGGKKYERDFLKRALDGEFPITVISTGMKKKIERMYGRDIHNCINVVCNSFSFPKLHRTCYTIRDKYGIPQNGKVVLSVGNITNNKNQIQLVRVFGHLSEDMQRNTYILFCGKPDISCGVELEIAKQKMSSHFTMCGVVDKKELAFFYQESDCVVLLSIAEGFGLSLIEGMHWGKPCMSFSDVDAFSDIYNPDVMIGVDSHSDEAVAKGLEELLTKKWNEELIKEHSRKFENETMGKNYLNVYKNVTAGVNH